MKEAGIGTAFFIVAILMLNGCVNIGPDMVGRDRFDYTAALSDSCKEQMLLNMVKLRYGDTPIFLPVLVLDRR